MPWTYDKNDDPKVLIDPKLMNTRHFDDYVEMFGDKFYVYLRTVVSPENNACAYTYLEWDAQRIAAALNRGSLSSQKLVELEYEGRGEENVYFKGPDGVRYFVKDLSGNTSCLGS